MNKDLHSFETLVEDPNFVDWVKNGRTSPSEYNGSDPKDVQKATLFVQASQASRQQVTTIDKSKLWNRIQKSIDQPVVNTPKVVSLWSSPWLKIASAVAAVFIAWIFLNPSTNSVGMDTAPQFTALSTVNQKQQFTLPDQSVVEVDAKTKVSYDKTNFATSRKINLEGRAFFSVQKGSTFEVQTPYGSVTVLGTSFDVVARNDVFETTCLTGKVLVKTPNGEVVLVPGEKAKWQNKILVKETATPDASAWVSGTFSFENRPLSVVFEELERQYGIKIESSAEVRDRKYTGFFTTKELKDALYAITWPMKLNYVVKEEGKVIVIE